MKYLTFNELREKLGGRGRTTIYRDIESGRLPVPIKLGGLNYFAEHLVDEALKRLMDVPRTDESVGISSKSDREVTGRLRQNSSESSSK